MQRRLGRIPAGFWLLALCALLSFLIPASREMHVLTARLLLHLKSKTFVQGQPPGCRVYIVPNVGFSKAYASELKRESGRSPDSYLIAAGANGYGDLKLPPPQAWTHHPLLFWATLHLQRSGAITEQTEREKMRQKMFSALITLAKSEYPESGMLWLAEASEAFNREDQGAAHRALDAALQKSEWSWRFSDSTSYIRELFQQNGLSGLDASIQANFLSSEVGAKRILANVARGLEARMQAAVIGNRKEDFINELSLWQQLGELSWTENSINNRFRAFIPSDDLVNAMAAQVGLNVPEFGKASFEQRKELKKTVMLNYLSLVIGPDPARKLISKSDAVVQSLEAQKSHIHQEDQRLFRSAAYATLPGMFALLILAGIGSYVLGLLAFRAIGTGGGLASPLRCGLALVLAIVGSTLLFASAMIALGPEEIGFMISKEHETRKLTYIQSGWISAGTIVMSLLVATLAIRKCLGEKGRYLWTRYLPLVLGYVYLALIAISAYFREEVARLISHA